MCGVAGVNSDLIPVCKIERHLTAYCRFAGDFSMSVDKTRESHWDRDSIPPLRFDNISEAGVGALRLALLFGSAVIALALIAVPMLAGRDQAVRPGSAGLDMVNTGSIGHGTYTIHRSVLQPHPEAVCVIRSDGSQTGQC
jgi:hypothetical protein